MFYLYGVMFVHSISHKQNFYFWGYQNGQHMADFRTIHIDLGKQIIVTFAIIICSCVCRDLCLFRDQMGLWGASHVAYGSSHVAHISL